jgi:thioredoxin reductase
MSGEAIDVAIIGAGPYGLSIAAHLSSLKVAFRIFGTPMSSWRNHMAAGTFLKSFGFASCLYDPGSTFTFAHYCQERGIHYDEVITPVAIENFTAYGMEFQRRFVSNLEQTDITSLRRAPEGFALTTQTGEVVLARRVVVAVGITHFGYVPPIFADLPAELVTHSSQYTHVDKFNGRTVAVIGAGASAADLAGLLADAGATVHMIARGDTVHFHEPPGAEPRPLSERILKPRSGLGQGWRSRLCSDFPLLFHKLPAKLRLKALETVNGPAPGWWTKDKVVGRVTIHLGSDTKQVNVLADVPDKHLQLHLSQSDGTSKDLQVDHVIAATGYKVKFKRLNFIDPDLLNQMEKIEDTPVLSTNFESSIPGLYVVGLASAASFGPLCRFAFGAQYTSDRIARHLADTVQKSPLGNRKTQSADLVTQ